VAQPTTQVEVAVAEPVAINSGQAVGLAAVATSQPASLPRMLSKASATWDNGSRAQRTASAPTLALPRQIAAAPTPCGSRQPLLQLGQASEAAFGAPPPLRAELGAGHSMTITPATLRPSVGLSQRRFLSRSSCPATGDSTWSLPQQQQPPAPHKVVAAPNAAASPMVQPRRFSMALPPGLPRQGSWQTAAPEGLKAESWSSFVARLPSPVNMLFPPMEFQFHKTDSVAGDDMPREDHRSLPRLPAAPPVTTSSEDRHNGTLALALGRRSVGEVRISPRSQDWEDGSQALLDRQQAQEDQGQQLEHIRSLALDLASTVQELCEMQRKMGHELQEVRLQVNHNSHDLEEFRSSFAQPSGMQRSGAQPPPLALAPPSSSHYETQSPAHQPTNSMVSPPQLDCRTHTPQDSHLEVPIPTPVSQRSTASAARNLGYSNTQDLLHSVHGRALEGLGSLHDWTARAMHNLVAGNSTGSNLCCQASDRQSHRPLTRI